MAPSDFTSAARSLALPIDDGDDAEGRPSFSQRRSTDRPWHRRASGAQPGASGTRAKWMQTAGTWQRRATRTWQSFTPLQRAGFLIVTLILFVSTVLIFVYNERIFAWLSPVAKRWRDLHGGWLILFSMTFFVSFPPLIGYSTCVTLAGFVFGMKGWLIVASGSILGSLCSFIVSRTLLRDFVARLTEKNQRFAALSLVLKHDGLKLLVMIRLCPLPYSLSNGAISTIPSVTWQNFAIATALASPKLMLHVFVGSRIGDLAENGDKMDTRTKIVSYISIAIGVGAGILTGYLVYMRTKARAAQLEAEEGAGDGTTGDARRQSSSLREAEYGDDPDERHGAVPPLPRQADDISLHHTYEDDVERGRGVYRDEFTDDEDAHEHDIFDDGDGWSETEDGDGKGLR